MNMFRDQLPTLKLRVLPFEKVVKSVVSKMASKCFFQIWHIINNKQ